MRALWQNRTFLTLTGADFFETLGISLFNIVLLTYAKTFTDAKVLISIVSVATVLPGVFGMFTGRLADQLVAKHRWLIGTKFLQAVLYVLLAQLITVHTRTVFMVVVVINVFSDILGGFSSNLRMPMLQAKVPTTIREEAIGVNQGVSTFMQIIGQAIGVALIGMTGDYQLAGYVNAGTFLLAGLVLLSGQRSIIVVITRAATRPTWRHLLVQIKTAFEASVGVNVVALFGNIMLINAVGASIDAIINLFLLSQGTRLPISFSVAVLITNTIFIIGMIVGSVLHMGIFESWSYQRFVWITIVTVTGIYLNLMTWQNYWLVVFGMGIAGFCMGQVNPKLNASLLRVADAEIVGSLQGLLTSLSAISLPIGSIGIVLVYNVVSSDAAYWLSIVLLMMSGSCLLIPTRQARA